MRASHRVKADLVAAKERAAVARQGLVAANREVTKLTAEAEAADAELPAKHQCTRAPLKAWETATKGWSAEQWSAFEAAEQKRRAKPIDNDTCHGFVLEIDHFESLYGEKNPEAGFKDLRRRLRRALKKA